MRKLSFYLCNAWNMLTLKFKRKKLEKLEKTNKEEAEKYLAKVALDWASSIINSVNIDLEVVGRENIPNEPSLFVGNHQSYLDIMVMLVAVNKPIGFVAKQELRKLPSYWYWMERVNSVFLDRDNPREGLKAINKAIENIKNGDSMGIFPEGTRSKGNEMGEFKKGSLRIALKSGCKVVPITMDGTHKGFENAQKGLGKVKVKVTIHKPIDIKQLGKEEEGKLTENIRETIYTQLKGR